jgi:hypothetical protein
MLFAINNTYRHYILLVVGIEAVKLKIISSCYCL